MDHVRSLIGATQIGCAATAQPCRVSKASAQGTKRLMPVVGVAQERDGG